VIENILLQSFVVQSSVWLSYYYKWDFFWGHHVEPQEVTLEKEDEPFDCLETT